MPTWYRPARPDPLAQLPKAVLGVLACLAAACTYDASRLQARPPANADTARPSATGPEAGTPDGDAANRVDGADSAPDAADAPGPDQSDAADGLADGPEPDATDDGIPADGFADSADLVASYPDGSYDGGDASAGAGGTTGAGGTGGAGEDGGGSGDANSGGTGGGGMGGTGIDAAGGAGGTGGSTGGSTGGTGGAGGTGGGTGGTGIDPDLVLWYKFDESSGTIAADSAQAGTGGHDGTLGTAGTGGRATFTTDYQVGTHALSLTPSSAASNSGGGYVTVPAPASLAPGAITIAVWVKLAVATSSQDWDRIFDFGSGTATNAPYLYLTARDPSSANTPVRFGVTSVGHLDPGLQSLVGTTTLSATVWHHIAVVLPAGATYTGTLYIDGAVAATRDAMTLHLSDVGVTTQNWLGRSPYTNDPFFDGSLDDFRIYKRALTASEITALMALR